ncbi:hypothetical protein PRELSG_1310900 [Plasmodium relictum]|uniref:Uncharacterized protein n=1 Tax=Plasmodium relictum TaxID=85471 RepID=A0A1J1HD97_PLARL|nr:hypothetical protein PRELSG_1310900 [Plasmodium relictum]CRH03750.1 hypothetical protein PRELSG_1310900 [Plasmodium relictum]
MKVYSNNKKVNLINNEKYNNYVFTKYGYVNKNKERNLGKINKVCLENYESKENIYKSKNDQIRKVILKNLDNNYINDSNQLNKSNLKKEYSINTTKISNIKKTSRESSIIDYTLKNNKVKKKNEVINSTIFVKNLIDENKNIKKLSEKSIIQDSCVYAKESHKLHNFNFTDYYLKKNDKKEIILNKFSNKINDKKEKNMQIISFKKDNVSQKKIFLNISPNMTCKLKEKDNQKICINNKKNTNFSHKNFNVKNISLSFNKNVLDIKKETFKEKNSDKSFLSQLNNRFLRIKKNEEIFYNNNNDKKKLHLSNSIKDNYFKINQNNNYNISYLNLYDTKRFSPKSSTIYKQIINHKIKIRTLEEYINKNKNANKIFYLNKKKLKKTKEIFSNKVNILNLKKDSKNIYNATKKDSNNKKRNINFTEKINDEITNKDSNLNFIKKQNDENTKHSNLKGELNNRKSNKHTKAVPIEKMKSSNNSFYINTIHKSTWISDTSRNDNFIMNKEQEDKKKYISKDTKKIERTRKLFEDKNILNEKKLSKENIYCFIQNNILSDEDFIIRKKEDEIEKQKQIQEKKKQSIKKDKNAKIKKKSYVKHFERYGTAYKKKYKNKKKKSRHEQDKEMKKKEKKKKK